MITLEQVIDDAIRKDVAQLCEEVAALKKYNEKLEYDLAIIRRQMVALSIAAGVYTDDFRTVEEQFKLLQEFSFSLAKADGNNKKLYTADIQIFELLRERKRVTTGAAMKAFGITRPTAISAMRRLQETYPRQVKMTKEKIDGVPRRSYVLYLVA